MSDINSAFKPPTMARPPKVRSLSEPAPLDKKQRRSPMCRRDKNLDVILCLFVIFVILYKMYDFYRSYRGD